MVTLPAEGLPIFRCLRCGARWVLQRVAATNEPGEPLYCLACGEEYLLESGAPVRLPPPDPRGANRPAHLGPHASPATIARQLRGGRDGDA